MILQLKKIIKRNSNVELFIRYTITPYFLFILLLSDLKLFLKAKTKTTGGIYKFKNKHKGKRCFIVATGPSLTFDDLSLLKNEICFGMNSAALALKNTDWIPEYYGIQDKYVYQKLENEILAASKNELKNVFVSNSLKSKFKMPKEFNSFFHHNLDHYFPHRKSYGKFKFSSDCDKVVYDGYSITYSLLQIACYMGFKEVYLIGSDCNYQQPKSHFIEYGHRDPHAYIMGDKIIKGHIAAKKYCDANDIKVINCTRGGMLEVYPRMKLEEVLKIKLK